MILEIPDMNVLLGLAGAFVAGLVVLIVYYKVRPYVNLTPKGSRNHQDPRLEEYERQLVEMKIRLDAISVGEGVMGISQVVDNVGVEESVRTIEVPKTPKNTPKKAQTSAQVVQNTPNITHHNAVEWALHQVTESPKTSRDIQGVLGKSREHTARLLKKLYDDGLVERNTETKPYTYSITDAGQKYIEERK